MKKILQAAALILMAASVVYAAAHSHPDSEEICKREWNQVYSEKTTDVIAKTGEALDTGVAHKRAGE